MPSSKAHLQALALLAIYGGNFILATPGCDSMPVKLMKTQEERDRYKEDIPSIAVDVAWIALEANRQVRLPLSKKLTFLQRPLRISQSWALYGGGPDQALTMEVYVDDTLRYRTMDDELTWQEGRYRYRRVRPMLDTISTKPTATNRDGPVRLTIAAALAENPDVRSVEIRFSSLPMPPKDTSPVIAHRLIARAPDWETELIR